MLIFCKMLKYGLIVLLFIGVFFTRVNAFGCVKNAIKHPCKTEYITKNSKKECSCCNNTHKGCKGCSHSKCSCSVSCSTSMSFASFFETSKYNNTDFLFIEKIKFPSDTPSVLEGFHSLWLIPKIS